VIVEPAGIDPATSKRTRPRRVLRLSAWLVLPAKRDDPAPLLMLPRASS
jgi:hypothetical protein